MNAPELTALAKRLRIDDESRFELRIAFGVACIERVEAWLTEQPVIDCLEVGKRYLRGEASRTQLAAAAGSSGELARSHPGSGSLDGSGSAAASTSHGVAAALAGRALDAANYAAYAKVYAYAGYAVTDPASYAEEHAWQLGELQRLAGILG